MCDEDGTKFVIISSDANIYKAFYMIVYKNLQFAYFQMLSMLRALIL